MIVDEHHDDGDHPSKAVANWLALSICLVGSLGRPYVMFQAKPDFYYRDSAMGRTSVGFFHTCEFAGRTKILDVSVQNCHAYDYAQDGLAFLHTYLTRRRAYYGAMPEQSRLATS